MKISKKISGRLYKYPFLQFLMRGLKYGNWYTNKFLATHPPGHYYSPIPSTLEVEQDKYRIFRPQADVLGVDMNLHGQLNLLQEMRSDCAFFDAKARRGSAEVGDGRYFSDNNMFCRADAAVLFSLLRKFRPARIVEVGSGFSSALMLDVLSLTPSYSPLLTFVDSDVSRVEQLIGSTHRKDVRTLKGRIQDLGGFIPEFLKSGDLLFIDSSHVAKIGSDLNYIFFDLLPRLDKGVIIHFHDIFWPFEYPASWVNMGVCWNEIYMVRALLSGGENFRVLFHLSYLSSLRPDLVYSAIASADRDSGGSLYVVKN